MLIIKNSILSKKLPLVPNTFYSSLPSILFTISSIRGYQKKKSLVYYIGLFWISMNLGKVFIEKKKRIKNSIVFGLFSFLL